ncbi:phage antirepressor N-terminal domain-containing protein [Denitromonas sp.]|uniref:phage antirepressor N-terminal domain-containing protein n=1 Tax=Denitromonas sp. TaxID=2734609 RepID=UPI003A8887E2
MKHIAISIEYAGLTLPVVKNAQGLEHVPLKPICELFGLKWETQRTKVSERFYADYLGICTLKALVCTPLKGGADDQIREHTFLRLDRVAAFLMTINPDRVRANGNDSGADFLQAKLTEWADALHDYETFGSAHNPRHADALLAIRQANAIANVAKMKDATLRRIALARLGIDETTATASPNGDLFATP